MHAGLFAFALLLTAGSALALYASSPHCMWRRLRGRPRLARALGAASAVAALALWIDGLGVAAGLVTALVAGMLALASQPWLALLAGTPLADPDAAERS